MSQTHVKDVHRIIVPSGTDDAVLEHLAKSSLRENRGYVDFEIFGIFQLDPGPEITLPDGRVIPGEHEVYAVVFDNYTLPN